MLFGKKKKNKFTAGLISPDEVFLDSKNIPNFDSGQFEGRMEQSISSRVYLFMTVVFLLSGFFLISRVSYLQIAKGADFADRAENNHLRFIYLSPERGLIYDRNEEVLAWNNPAFRLILKKEAFEQEDLTAKINTFLGFLDKKDVNREKDVVLGIFNDWNEVNNIYQQWSYLPLRIETISLRTYKDISGVSHLVGYTGYVSAFESEVGKEGVEKSFNDILSGKKGIKLVEVDSLDKIKSENIQEYPVQGENIYLSVDYRIQEKLYEIFSNLALERGFKGASGVILDVENGEVLAMTNYPEYDSQILSRGQEEREISNYRNDPRKPFLNRAVTGLYAPGSVVKPIVAIAALVEKIISPDKQIFSSGSISVPNPYFPEEESVFYDWKAHGFVDMKQALAVSSNVYFYTIGGGHDGVNGLGIKRLKDYFNLFGLGEKTGINLGGEAGGIISDPDLKKKNSSDPVWRVGDTYNISIGQGDFQITPLQMVTAISTIANEGLVVNPKIILGNKSGDFEDLDIPEEYFQVVKDGMRRAVLLGTASALGGLPVKIGAKTGTAELGSGKFVNSWLVAFWPFEKPRYAISIVLEKGNSSNLIGGVFAMKELIEWMFIHTPEYLSLTKIE